jgi:adenosylcobyric acid synthase
MNPVLLKPQSDTGSQVVVQGEVWQTTKAAEYYALKPRLMPKVLESFARLRAAADLVLVEGAGSAAEVNLRAGDIANMGFAKAANTPVVLIGDIDRGGVIASIVGTMALIAPEERALMAGYVINRFRGDPTLFDSGLSILTERTRLPSFGVIPYFQLARQLPAEDSVALDNATASASARGPEAIRVVVPVLSRIANFDDLDPLIAEPGVEVEFVRMGRALPGDADLVVLPGSKSTIADLNEVRAQGWHIDLEAHIRRGGWVIGLCGGFHTAQGVARNNRHAREFWRTGAWLRDSHGSDNVRRQRPARVPPG